MEKLNFELMIASPYDREKLVVEINYKNDIPVFIEQETIRIKNFSNLLKKHI